MPCSCCSGETHKKETFEPFIDSAPLAKTCKLDNGNKKFSLPMAGPERSQCPLQALPVECYQACLQYLDVATLTTMRRVSQFTRLSIDSLHPYRELYEHAPQAIRACLSTGVAPHIPLLRLHDSLTSMECYYCKTADPSRAQFGSYLSLFECHRACLFCLRNNPALLAVDLMTILTLCCKRNCSIRSIDSFRLLGTLPGVYGPHSTQVQKGTLVRGPSAITNSGVSLSEKEQQILYGRTPSATIYHHPLVKPEEESDIGPAVGYVSPDTQKKTLHTYQTAILFPYLANDKKTSDYGVMCGECNLHMRFEENRWMNEQSNRRRHHQDPTASLRTRDFINEVRRLGCMQYTASEEAARDAKEHEVPQDKEGEEKTNTCMSIQEHRLVHVREKLPREELEYRAKMRKPMQPVIVG